MLKEAMVAFVVSASTVAGMIVMAYIMVGYILLISIISFD